MSDKPRKTVEERLQEWAKTSHASVAPGEKMFIAAMRCAKDEGVGYGFMQQVIEWEWDHLTGCAWGPNYFEAKIKKLEEENAKLLALCEAAAHDDPGWRKEVGKLMKAAHKRRK